MNRESPTELRQKFKNKMKWVGNCNLGDFWFSFNAQCNKNHNLFQIRKGWPLSGPRHTFFPGLGNDVGSTLAHHLGNVERAVGLAGDGDGSEHRLRLQLHGQDTTLVTSPLVTVTFRGGYCMAICLYATALTITVKYCNASTLLWYILHFYIEMLWTVAWINNCIAYVYPSSPWLPKSF